MKSSADRNDDEKRNLVQEAIQMFVMVDYVRGMTVKSCKCSEDGLFEHLLCLFNFFFGGGDGVLICTNTLIA